MADQEIDDKVARLEYFEQLDEATQRVRYTEIYEIFNSLPKNIKFDRTMMTQEVNDKIDRLERLQADVEQLEGDAKCARYSEMADIAGWLSKNVGFNHTSRPNSPPIITGDRMLDIQNFIKPQM
jgi:hypothetical protein